MKRSITPSELAKRLETGGAPLILDVRRTEDAQADPSQVPGAEGRDPTEAEVWAAELPPDREVVIYCKHGRSISNTVLETLQARGVNACFIEGGLTAWNEAADDKPHVEKS
ncbi:MAG: rhodanese-like domain-containing protein [Marinobacter sp.]|uniref:rhodanese-like domain-containing protein n=1 Tax=Marinobacter sp. TaxID=50741 RepID=UPI00329A5018